MDYEGVNSVVCDAEESDWLDVSYAERKYVNKERKRSKNRAALKINKKLAITAAAIILCLAVLAVMLFVDGGFSKDVFGAAKTVFSSTVFGGKTDKLENNKIEIPCNISLVTVEDGVATFEGGRATLSFTSGKVTEATETGVKVAIDEKTAIAYEGLTKVMVAVGDDVAVNSLLGKYDGQFTATIVSNGETVKEVVGSSTELTWNV